MAREKEVFDLVLIDIIWMFKWLNLIWIIIIRCLFRQEIERSREGRVEAEALAGCERGLNWTNIHSCLKWPLEEIYNLIFEHLTYSAISVPNWNTLQKYFSLAHYLTEMIKTFWGGKEDASLARNEFLGCLQTLELLEKGLSVK